LDAAESVTVNEAVQKLGLADQKGILPGFRTGLLPFQLILVSWMNDRELATEAGGILADSMGLGKTVQMLAIMAYRRSQYAEIKTNLVVVYALSLC
jgi:SNF2 family DNA or RNA helicase